MEWRLFVSFNFFFFEEEKFPVFVHYFTLLSLNLHLKQLSRFEQIWIRNRLPRDIVQETMKGYKLEETNAKERKKEKDWGKKWRLLQNGGKQSKIRLFPSLRPNAKRKREEWDKGSDKSDLHRLPSILIFSNNFFSKEIRCIVSNGSFTFFFNYCHQNFISFDVRSFLTKL